MTKYDFIDKDFLIKEYTKNKKSSIKIARRLDCSVNTIRDKLIKYNIKTRTHSEARLGKFTGKNSFGYIDGRWIDKHYCIDCGCEICYGSTRCGSCARTGENSPIFKGKEAKHRKKYFCIDCNKEIHYNTFLYGGKRCQFCSNKLENNPMYGKSSPHSKRIYYKGICMRSSWEVAFAYFLDCSGYKWLYESKVFNLGKSTYRPDFYLPEFDCYIEIKGWWRDNAKEKFKLFKKLYSKITINILRKKNLEKLGVLL